MKINLKLLFILCAFSILYSCDKPPCSNSNKIFENLHPSSREYKAELQTTLPLHSNLQWWVKNYIECDDKKWLIAEVQGEDLCATVEMLLLDQNRGIEQLVKNKGVGYLGAELINVEYKFLHQYDSGEIVFLSAERLID